MAVIITNMDMPSKCYECVMRNKSMCGITGLYLPQLDVIRGDCPLKSTDDMINKIEREANNGMWSEATVYGMLKAIWIIKEYCKGADDESNYD